MTTPTFARRMATVPRSFIREILKVTEKPHIISFAGGLPNPAFIPVQSRGGGGGRGPGPPPPPPRPPPTPPPPLAPQPKPGGGGK